MDHAQIPVKRFGGVDEKGGRAGGGKGGGNLAANDSGFAHTYDNNTSLDG